MSGAGGRERIAVRVSAESPDAVPFQLADGSPVLRLRAARDTAVGEGSRALVPTGVRMALPPGYAGFAIPARAFAAGEGLVFANSPGLIDTGYRGEVQGIACALPGSGGVQVPAGAHFMDLFVCKTARGDESRREGGAMGRAVLEMNMLVEGVEPPAYAHDDDNGLDLRAAEGFVLEPFERREVGLCIGIALDEGHIAQIQPRSGLSLKKGLSIAGSPCIVEDPDPREMLKACFVNLDPREPIAIERGERIAQLVILERPYVEVRLCGDLDGTERGSGGFGSSGS